MRVLMSAALVASLAAPAWASGGWVVLPARGERPPPRDPTLLRLTGAIATALEAIVDGPAPVVARDLADDACPSETGECPRDVALFVNAAHVLSLVLREDQSAVDVRAYAPKIGLERQLTLPCTWVDGRASCDTAGLAQLASSAARAAPPTAAAGAAPAPARRGKGRAAEPPPPPGPVDEAFAAALPNLARCKKKGWGADAPASRPEAFAIRFRTTAEGALRDVRVDPAGFTDVPALACMARIVESIRLPAGVLADGVESRPLPWP